jgi:hypothetical protein
MTLAELKRERRYWQTKSELLGHREARKGSLDRMREIDKVVARRFPSSDQEATC